MKYIDEVELSGKRVVIRADFDVPLDENGKVVNDTRIEAALPTIRLALEKGGKVILLAHMGRPKGRDEKLSLRSVLPVLSERLGCKVEFGDDCIGADAESKAAKLLPGGVLLLENVRYHGEEEKNDPKFAEALAKLADVYVNNAFATAHRAHASTAGIVKYVPIAVGGLTLKNELSYFAKAFENPARPLVAIFGGAKVSTKIDAIRHVGKKANRIVVGGAMANTFFASRGLNIGKSLYEPEAVQTARDTEKMLGDLGCELLLPVDVVVGDKLAPGAKVQTVDVRSVPADMMALDIGPKSIELFKSGIQDAKTIIWNGPMGAFETPGFSAGTHAIVHALSESPALTVVGGGDTDLALEQCDAAENMDYVSTAGGAFLCLLEGAPLPAVDALKAK